MSGGWHRACRGERLGRDGEGAADDVIPNGEATRLRDFLAHAVEAVEEQLAEIGEDGGLAAGDAIGGEKGKEPAKGMVDVGGGHEFAGDRSKLGGDTLGVKDKALAAGVVEAEGGVAVPAGVAALAAVGVGVAASMLADGQRLYLAGIAGLGLHLRTSGSGFPYKRRDGVRRGDVPKVREAGCQQPEHNGY